MTTNGGSPTREAAPDTGFPAMGALLGICLVVAGIGLWLLVGEIAPRIGLIAFYTGAPVSAVFGVIGGGLVLAWPLDLTLIIVAGFALGRLTVAHDRPWWQGTLFALAIFLAMALVANLLVTADPDWVQIWTSREG